MRIAFCTTCKGRVQHIRQTLPRNLADNKAYPDAVFIIVDYGSPDDLLGYLQEEYANEISSGRLVVYSIKDPPASFRMAHAKNLAHRCGIAEGAEILVNLDADNYTGVDFAAYIAREFERCSDRIFLRARMLKGIMPRGINGRIILSSSAFVKVGGYDEKYDAWGPDDKDFNVRLRRLGYEELDIPAQYLTGVKHSEGMRFREYPHARNICREYDEEEFWLKGSETTVVNAGNIGCARLVRNFCEEVEITPLPSRIFGIGLHKTGTTSLHEALRTLGFDCAHWTSAHWARRIWNEMQDSGRSRTLEHHYALCDLPIPLLFRELDKAYPGSKFILTVRDEVDWLRSVRNHWRSSGNRYRESWDNDPFTHRVHQELYGRRDFDAGVFLARYQLHNAQVREYFANRPGDLLTLDIDHENKWGPLCALLKATAPSCSYPKANEGDRTS